MWRLRPCRFSEVLFSANQLEFKYREKYGKGCTRLPDLKREELKLKEPYESLREEHSKLLRNIQRDAVPF
jgi:hypothetical protein